MYGVSKGGLNAFMKGMALEMASIGIRSNSVNPGFVATNILSAGTISEEDLKKKKPRAKAATPTPKPRVVKKADSQPPTDALIGTLCPKCGQGHLLKGKTAYGCSRWKEGCDYRVPF